MEGIMLKEQLMNIRFKKAHSSLLEQEQKAYLDCFEHPFRERVAESYRLFEEKEEELRSYIDRNSHDEILNLCTQILKPALIDPTYEIGFNGKQYQLILSPNGSLVSLFVLDYYREHITEPLKKNWNILIGRQPNPNWEIRIDDITINAQEVDMWIEQQQGERSFCLSLYCAKLVPVLKTDENAAYNIVYILLDNTIGELIDMKYIYDVELLENKRKEASMALSALPAFLKKECKIKKKEIFTPGIFYENYECYQPMEVEEEDYRADRSDIYAGITRCPPCINEFMTNEHRIINHLANQGICAGYFVYPNDIFDYTEDRGKIILDFREELQQKIFEMTGGDYVFITGGASGVFCSYIDFLAWDVHALLEAAEAVFRESSLEEGFYHSMRADAGLVVLKKWKTKKRG